MAKPKRRRTLAERPNTYKQWCDNHPDDRAIYSFVEKRTGKSRGLCQDCFDRERRIAMKRLRIKRARTRRK